ncbi:class I SAM-dependent methyltransferase [Sphingomonas sp. MG17]|uniref:Class I SAM-dependent methyltransferase n=1 Tax=Sphingomonas tagetis TaxID=2949092 RepID=A0A9X2KKS1_9SPHN|nr:class I SAM-dependent methyltransferase [Sphingomonas tagetis]MCP3729912.1 class I SAM-dependent methyltransferase [Sphingomonas tagetis]
MMFDDPKVQAVHLAYEVRNAAEAERVRTGGVSGVDIRDELLLPVGTEVGQLLHALILARKPRRILELGTSYGYSTLFLADAARAVGGTVITMENADYKQAESRRQIAAAGLSDHVDFRLGDAVAMIAADDGPFDVVLLDIWKELYLPCFEAFYPRLSEEAIVAADNMIFPPQARPDVRAYREAVRAKGDMQQVLLPVGSGVELAVKWSAGSAKL